VWRVAHKATGASCLRNSWSQAVSSEIFGRSILSLPVEPHGAVHQGPLRKRLTGKANASLATRVNRKRRKGFLVGTRKCLEGDVGPAHDALMLAGWRFVVYPHARPPEASLCDAKIRCPLLHEDPSFPAQGSGLRGPTRGPNPTSRHAQRKRQAYRGCTLDEGEPCNDISSI